MKDFKIYIITIICLLATGLGLSALAKPKTIEQTQAYSPYNISFEHNATLSDTNNTATQSSTFVIKTSATQPESTAITTTKEIRSTTTTTRKTSTKKQTTTRSNDNERIYLGKYKLTAYCPCSKCSGSWGRQTSTGAIATEGRTIGVDPNIIEYGTEVYIEGVGVRVAEDTGSAVNNKHIDIFMDSHADCKEFGVKYADVYIVKE